jgi:murein DD-endopeptidase MepM/ murein hydrolase activator NlpD
MMKFAAALVLLVLVAVGVVVGAGYLPGPAVEIVGPERYVGVSTPLEVVVDPPAGRVSDLRIAFEQDGTRTMVYEAGGPGGEAVPAPAGAEGDPPGRIRISRTISREAVPGLRSGAGRVVVTASRPVLNGLRQVSTEVTHDVEVRLERPRLSVLSTHHYINQGGSEMVVYRVTPDDVSSGVRVGELEYPGYPASGVAVEGASFSDPAVRVAFFALLHDQPTDTPIRLYARDPAGNTAEAAFEHRIFPKRFRQSRISLDDAFIERVVPSILAGTDEVAPTGSPIDQYVVVNGELRRLNAERIASFADETALEMLWRGQVFHTFVNNAVESGFADRRTYIYQGREVDRQTHLGFDLASYAQTPIVAANRGRVVFADELGIYGNCVIVDHGMGLQSLYAHLSTIDVRPGDLVEKEQQIGRSGVTGLAGGDHLHFTMLLAGRMVNPIEWWDPHWIEDRVLRKLRLGQ